MEIATLPDHNPTINPLQQENTKPDTDPKHRPKLINETRLLRQFEQDIAVAGLVGEEENAKVVFLSAVSAKLQKPLNVSVSGESSAGKNHLTGCVAKFIPDEGKKILTGMSAKVLMHSDEHEYEHKAVFIAEYEGVSGADYAIRTMQSEQVIEWEFVDSSNSGIQKKKCTVRGPAAFIQATTRVTLHPENETRLLFVRIDESEEQTKAINEQQAWEAAEGASRRPEDLVESWHELLRSFTATQVRIPFAPQLARHFPPDHVRSRRDFPKLLSLIEAIAYLHQDHRTRDKEGRIIAAPQDYLDAKGLFEHCYSAGPEVAVGKMLEVLGAPGSEFSVADLMSKTGWKKTKAYEMVGRAEELGCIAEGEGRGRYKLLRAHSDPPLALPDKLWLTARDFRISAGLPS
jgi:hypothetical protein